MQGGLEWSFATEFYRMSSAGTAASTATLSQLYPLSALPELRHRRFTVEEYENLVRSGTLTENDRCELIRGVIADKIGIGNLHMACVKRLNRFFHARAGVRYTVSIQDPIKLADSEPEPDCALVKFRDDYYRDAKPSASEVLLLIEVADSSLELDRGAKLALYAEAGIEDYWVVNVIDDCMEICRRPQRSGAYGDRKVLQRGSDLSPLSLPDVHLLVEDILGPRVAT
jgi:Uma2 family endonuclease